MPSRLFLIFVLFFSYQFKNAQAQKNVEATIVKNEVFCTFPLNKQQNQISKPYEFKNAYDQRFLEWSFEYVADGDSLFNLECATWNPSAQAALSFAAGIWSDALESSQNIRVRACWCDDVNLAMGTLGQAGAAYFLSFSSGSTIIPNTFYPVPLVEDIINAEHTDIDSVDIVALFNAKRTDWYFGTDAMPGSDIDFVTTALHELGHGLGFTGSARYDDGDAMNGEECNGTVDVGCFSLSLPTIYDRFIDIDDESSILLQTNPSLALGTELTSNGLEFDEENSNVHRSSHGIDVHSPATFVPGSSYSHFSEATLADELMSPSVAAGQAIHDPGMSLLVMQEIGWSEAIVPVELIDFSAKIKSKEVKLDWTTASEIDNDYFEVQKSYNEIDFSTIGKISGNGSTSEEHSYNFVDRMPLNGKNYYRLKQVDYNGELEYSDVKVVNFSGSSRGFTIAPNPVSDELVVSFNKSVGKNTVIEVYGVEGKILKSIDKDPDNLSSQIDTKDLANGTYYLRIISAGQISTMSFVKAN